jgi:hypothetical protein
VAWCALPFPQYPLPDDYGPGWIAEGPEEGHKVPGHGDARVQVNFWFFLFVYYGFYNVTALMWITKVFNIYSLNWYAMQADDFARLTDRETGGHRHLAFPSQFR